MSWAIFAAQMVDSYSAHYAEKLRKAKPGGVVRVRDIRNIQPMTVTRNAHKCPGCGSHEFRLHAGRNVCVYCRTSQSVAAPVWIDGAGMIP